MAGHSLFREHLQFAANKAASPAAYIAANKVTYSMLAKPLPANLHVVTLHAQSPTMALVRIAHMLAVGEGAECLVRVSRLPQHGVGGIQQNGRVQVGTQLRGDGDVVVVAVGAHHRDHMAPGDGVFDRLRIVCRVDDDHVGAVTDDPDVVVDFPTAAVEFKVAVGDDPLDSGLLGGH
jgi:uncharacterized protein (AIM24 family)